MVLEVLVKEAGGLSRCGSILDGLPIQSVVVLVGEGGGDFQREVVGGVG
ncbi:MAG: hypothetical protein IJV36_03735 [Prevotella sp.]|nr:hypothetical protein [Prevotella sp.]